MFCVECNPRKAHSFQPREQSSAVTASLAVPSLDQHYVYSLKEFQCFASNTYTGIWPRANVNTTKKESLSHVHTMCRCSC